MKRLFATACVALALVALPAFAEDPPYDVAYALNDAGALGIAYGSGKAGTEANAIEFCGGASAGCKIVLSARADCLAMSESRTAAGNYFWVGNTSGVNAYARSFEIKNVENMVMGWCKDSGAQACVVRHSDCMDYVRNLN